MPYHNSRYRLTQRLANLLVLAKHRLTRDPNPYAVHFSERAVDLPNRAPGL